MTPRQSVRMERVNGIGGFFFRADSQQGLIDWYRDNLGVETMNPSGAGGVWMQDRRSFRPFRLIPTTSADRSRPTC